ncbi:cobalamin biosynthesis protein [Macrococcus hajekii]|uniref:CobW family GTP-binding protein n=1 Tax=Macrococcus hajekii TaxID=198482 RepID=UPI00140D2C4D|nr:GTP-binding protein [Macrococcus hajekii]GGB07528.1 cobalamin biosynthesis protein [Macrococcus hajekii]
MDIIILGGFLGSGKTTLLQQLLQYQQSQGLKTYVLMNEFGQYSVDHLLVDDDVPLKKLLNGCICCDLKVDVEIQLHQLYLLHQPDCIIIESSGVAHPVEILDACLSPVLAPFTTIKALIGVIDGTLIQRFSILTADIKQLLIEQIKYCSTLLINKSDQLGDELEKVISDVRQIASTNQIIETQYCQLDDINVLFKNSVSSDYETTSRRSHSGIKSISCKLGRPLDAEQFAEWLEQLPSSIFRIKGILSFTEKPDTLYLVQYTNGTIETREIPIKIPPYLVIIGEQMDKESIKDEIEHMQ